MPTITPMRMAIMKKRMLKMLVKKLKKMSIIKGCN